MTLSLDAMNFARTVHARQRRKYTNNPYVDHLAEVAGIAMSVGWRSPVVHPDTMMAVCWLHDSMEDQGVPFEELVSRFGEMVALGVFQLSGLEPGKRAERKAASRARLAKAPSWVQTIKVADILSNTSSIVEHDRDFASIYLQEKVAMLDVLTRANAGLVAVARAQVQAGLEAIA